MSQEYAHLPKLLAEIAEVAGLGPALQIARARGGDRARFPSKASVAPGNWLHDLVGPEAALKISERFTSRGSIEVEIPLGPEGTFARRRRQIYEMIDGGKSSGQIARTLGVTRRTVVRARLAQAKTKGSQLELFEMPPGDVVKGS